MSPPIASRTPACCRLRIGARGRRQGVRPGRRPSSQKLEVGRATTAMLAAASRSASRSQLRGGNRAMLLEWLQVIATARRCSNTN